MVRIGSIKCQEASSSSGAVSDWESACDSMYLLASGDTRSLGDFSPATH